MNSSLLNYDAELLNLSSLLCGKAVSLTSFTKNGTFASWKLYLLGVEKVSWVSLSYRSTKFKSDKYLKIPVWEKQNTDYD